MRIVRRSPKAPIHSPSAPCYGTPANPLELLAPLCLHEDHPTSPMRVSVVIPVYNRQAGAERAIRSVRAQQGPWVEIVVVDDASAVPFFLPSDLKADARIHLVRVPQNVGESGARNVGVEAAEGDWIAYLDSDDYWLPGKLEAQTAFAADDQAGGLDPLVLYATGFTQSNLNNGVTRHRIPVGSSDRTDFASGVWLAQGSTALFPKELFRVVGPYDTELRRLMDLDWMLRFGLAGGRAKVAPVLGSVVEIGARPSPEGLELACAVMERKWLSASSPLDAVMRSRLQAYLDVERASAQRYRGNFPATVFYLARSLARAPRVTVPLKSWWTPA